MACPRLLDRPSVHNFPVLVCLGIPAFTVLRSLSSAMTPAPTLTSPLSGRAAIASPGPITWDIENERERSTACNFGTWECWSSDVHLCTGGYHPSRTESVLVTIARCAGMSPCATRDVLHSRETYGRSCIPRAGPLGTMLGTPLTSTNAASLTGSDIVDTV